MKPMLKKLFPFLFIMLCANAHAATVEAISGYIIDGDTFAATVKLENDTRISVRVRILGIDAPEMNGECESEIEWAHRSRDRLAELLPEGSIIQLSSIKDDKYIGRINAYVKIPDGRDVSAIMLKENLAVPYGGGKRQPWCE